MARPYGLLGKWPRMLGFRGHFSTKSRRYSVTLGRLRRARSRWQTSSPTRSRETGTPIDLADLEADSWPTTTPKPPSSSAYWAYVGTGWDNEGDAALARAAAARAREYAQHRGRRRARNDSNEIQGQRQGSVMDKQTERSAGADRC